MLFLRQCRGELGQPHAAPALSHRPLGSHWVAAVPVLLVERCEGTIKIPTPQGFVTVQDYGNAITSVNYFIAWKTKVREETWLISGSLPAYGKPEQAGALT